MTGWMIQQQNHPILSNVSQGRNMFAPLRFFQFFQLYEVAGHIALLTKVVLMASVNIPS